MNLTLKTLTLLCEQERRGHHVVLAVSLYPSPTTTRPFLFKPLSTFYSQCVDSWMRANPGLTVAEQKVTQFFGEPYSEAATISTAVNGFKKSGIWPINRNVIGDEEFAPSNVTEKPHPDDDDGVFSGRLWMTIEQVVY